MCADSVYGTILTGIGLLSIERYEISRLFLPDAGRDEQLRKFFANYDSVYSWLGSQEPTFVSSLRKVCDGEVRCFPFRPCSRVHAVDYYLSCVGAHGLSDERRQILRPGSEALTWAERYRAEHGLDDKRVLAMAPGSGGREKNWSVMAYAEVARWWKRQTGGAVLVILGPVEEENQEIVGNSGFGVSVLRGLTLDRVAAMLCLCDLYVGNDSGLTHLSAALGAKTIAIFGPTDPLRWAPRGERVKVLSLNLSCAPCDNATMKACPHRSCLNTLTAADVVANLARHSHSWRTDRADGASHLDKVMP
jgi:ADP-heptose:LPS heptosyltransferase